MSAKAMSEKNTMNVRTIERDIAILKKMGILASKGGRKYGEWIITNKRE